jgi:hypothetical protein
MQTFKGKQKPGVKLLPSVRTNGMPYRPYRLKDEDKHPVHAHPGSPGAAPAGF